MFSLVEACHLETEFEIFCDDFEKATKALNRFAAAIEYAIDKTALDKAPKKSKKGALLCYKIRCAIVHGGSSGPIFDSYDDANDLIDFVLPSLEYAVSKFLGISYS